MGALWAGGGAALTTIIAGFIPIGGGGMMDILKMGVAAYATGFIGERFTSPANAQLMAIGGFAGTAWSAVNMLLGSVRGSVGSFLPGLAPAQADGGISGYFADVTSYPPGALGDYDGMSDIVQAPPGFEYQSYQ